MIRTLRAIKFLFVGPLVLLLCFVINWMTFTGDWWVRWVALGIGIAWIVSFFRVLKAVIVAGGLAALIAYLNQRKSAGT
jgi:hypothetical protein